MSARKIRNLSIAAALTLLVAATACSSKDEPLVFDLQDSNETMVPSTEEPGELIVSDTRGPGRSSELVGAGGPPAPFWRALDYSASTDGITFGVEKFTLTSYGLYVFYTMTSDKGASESELVPQSVFMEDERGVRTEATRITHLGSAAGVSVGVISLPFLEVDSGTLRLNVVDVSSDFQLIIGNWDLAFVELLDGDVKPHGTSSGAPSGRITSAAFPALTSDDLVVDGLVIQDVKLRITETFFVSITPENGVEPLSSEQVKAIFGSGDLRFDPAQPNPVGATATPAFVPRSPTPTTTAVTPSPRPTWIPAPAGTFTGVFTPEDMQAQADTWPDEYRIWVNEETVVLFAYPHPIIDWVGPVFIKHIPSFSSVVINFDGKVDFEHINGDEGEAAISAVLADEELMAEITARRLLEWQ